MLNNIKVFLLGLGLWSGSVSWAIISGRGDDIHLLVTVGILSFVISHCFKG